jgi:hypothetical protein
VNSKNSNTNSQKESKGFNSKNQLDLKKTSDQAPHPRLDLFKSQHNRTNKPITHASTPKTSLTIRLKTSFTEAKKPNTLSKTSSRSPKQQPRTTKPIPYRGLNESLKTESNQQNQREKNTILKQATYKICSNTLTEEKTLSSKPETSHK